MLSRDTQPSGPVAEEIRSSGRGRDRLSVQGKDVPLTSMAAEYSHRARLAREAQGRPLVLSDEAAIAQVVDLLSPDDG